MSNDRRRIRQIKYHINQLVSEWNMIEPANNIPRLNISIDSQLTNISHEENSCPLLLYKSKVAILHSTTNSEYRKKSHKFCFTLSAQATSTPKSSPQQKRLLLKPHQTSTPRRSIRHSTALTTQPNNMIPLKRLLYNKKDYDQHKRRHSAVPFSKRSILPRLQPIDENPQWI
ncbi:hypothetical protein I4U23_025432 [Adineta vaga]|nr:hypothetical protein I4U23_025432 [Adineta vaga]